MNGGTLGRRKLRLKSEAALVPHTDAKSAKGESINFPPFTWH